MFAHECVLTGSLACCMRFNVDVKLQTKQLEASLDRIDTTLRHFPRLDRAPRSSKLNEFEQAATCEHGAGKRAGAQSRVASAAQAQVPRKSPVPRLSRRAQEGAHAQRGGTGAAAAPATLRSLRQRQRVRHDARLLDAGVHASDGCESAMVHGAPSTLTDGFSGLQESDASGVVHFPLLRDAAATGLLGDATLAWGLGGAPCMWPNANAAVAQHVPAQELDSGVGAGTFSFTQAALLHAAAMQSMREGWMCQQGAATAHPGLPALTFE